MNLSNYSDEELMRIAQGTPQQPTSRPDLSHMSDEELWAIVNGESKPEANKGPSFSQNISNALKGLKGKDAVETFNNTVEASGLPSLARGFVTAPYEVTKFIGNIPGNIERAFHHTSNIPRFPETNLPPIQHVNPAYGKAAEMFGSLMPFEAPITAGRKLLSIGGEKLAQPFKSAEHPFETIQKNYDQKQRAISNLFDRTSDEIKEAGLSKIPLKRNTLNEIKFLGPQTRTFGNFVEKARLGDYDALRKIQSELYKRGTKHAASKLPSENDLGQRIFELRHDINDAIAQHLVKNKRPDLAENIAKASKDYRNLQNVYHSHPTISKLVGADREIPATDSILSKQSNRMDVIRAQHPEIQKYLDREKRKEAAMQLGKILGYGTAIGAASTTPEIIRSLF